MTKLFEDDAYLKEFKAKIIGIVKEENRIELDKTAFYAKSGGQPGDTGAIEAESIKIQVLDTIKENNKIINIVDDLKDLEENAEIIESSILEEKPELVRTMSVKPPQVDGKIRLIRIGDIDLQPCGGTHVKSTNEIGKIQIGKIENKGKMNRRVNLLLSS